MREKFKVEAVKARLEDGERIYAAQRDGDSDEESESGDDDDMDEDGDEDMEGGESGQNGRGKEEPIIDEDGFEMVTKKSGRR